MEANTTYTGSNFTNLKHIIHLSDELNNLASSFFYSANSMQAVGKDLSINLVCHLCVNLLSIIWSFHNKDYVLIKF